jgi:K+-sensing histidine kinase KdpD
LDKLFSAIPIRFFNDIEEVARTYAEVAANAMSVGVEFWLYNEMTNSLHRRFHIGPGPLLTSRSILNPAQEGDWKVWFHRGYGTMSTPKFFTKAPSCLPEKPGFAVAWLPLMPQGQQFGLCALTYTHAHFFPTEEKRALEVFVSQWAADLMSTQLAASLRAAYEQQKQLDALKDQFLLTATHELRTPLTAVQGYIELLSAYNQELSAEKRAEFIEKAWRGTEELQLLVGNIMDVSRVQVDANNIKLSSVSLLKSVTHILEILEEVIKREERSVQTSIPANRFVLADDARLRQVLLNLVGNAIKYTPLGTPIEIGCEIDGDVW